MWKSQIGNPSRSAHKWTKVEIPKYHVDTQTEAAGNQETNTKEVATQPNIEVVENKSRRDLEEKKKKR